MGRYSFGYIGPDRMTGRRRVRQYDNPVRNRGQKLCNTFLAREKGTGQEYRGVVKYPRLRIAETCPRIRVDNLKTQFCQKLERAEPVGVFATVLIVGKT